MTDLSDACITTISGTTSSASTTDESAYLHEKYQIDCLGDQFYGTELITMKPAIWTTISIEMFQKENIAFIDNFRDNIDFGAVCAHFSTLEKSLSEAMIVRYLHLFKEKTKLLSCANLRSADVFKNHQSAFGESLKENPHYNEWHSKVPSIGGGFERKVSLEEKKSRPAMPVHYKKKQATDEERKQANLAAGIAPDPFNLAETPQKPSKYVITKNLPANAIRHEVHFVELVEKWNKKTLIYEYRDILPNKSLNSTCETLSSSIDRRSYINQDDYIKAITAAEMVKRDFPGRNPELCTEVMALIPTPTVELNPLAFFPINDNWISEVDLEKDIGIILSSNVVPTYILQHYKKQICENIDFISGSNYLTQEFIMYFGKIMRWERVNPLLYTPEIVVNYPNKVFTKHVFMMPEYEQLPNKKVFDGAYEELLQVIEKYKAERDSIVEKMARKQFASPPIEETNMYDFFMSTLQEDN